MLARDVVAAVLVQLEGQDGHPVFGRAIPYVTLCLSTTTRSMHHATERGRMAWQKASGYRWRALMEADIRRFKQLIADDLRSRTDRRRATEVAVSVLNQMLELGRPEHVRLT